MLWHPTISITGFRSQVLNTDETSTGKWLVPIPVPDIGCLWQEIEDAAVEGKIVAVKKSTDVLGRKLGHHLACVYCVASDADTVADTLKVLREIGVDGPLQYKSDRATFEWREEYLWTSEDFESTAKMAL